MPEPFVPVEMFPHRICLDIVPVLEKYLKDKVIYDIGCGGGDVLAYIKYKGISDKVSGIEFNGKRLNKNSNRDYIIKGNIFEMKVPRADVYYFWLGTNFDYPKLLNILKNANKNKDVILIDANGGFGENDNYFLNEQLIEAIEYEYDESKYNNKPYPPWKMKGKRMVRIYKLNTGNN